MLQKIRELGIDKTLSLHKQEILQKNSLKKALPGNITKVVFPQSKCKSTFHYFL